MQNSLKILLMLTYMNQQLDKKLLMILKILDLIIGFQDMEQAEHLQEFQEH